MPPVIPVVDKVVVVPAQIDDVPEIVPASGAGVTVTVVVAVEVKQG